MASPARRVEPDQIIFVGLAVILAALLIYFALSSIPSALRPTLQPPSNSPTAGVTTSATP